MSQLQDFDRELELEIFLQMLGAERQERVLDICACALPAGVCALNEV